MRIEQMFVKEIDRDIKGVIKVGQDDDSNIKQELSEYVVTKELNKHIRTFFESYKKGINGHTDKMGVWISGFFGSGKSHFLKILSYILENREVEGKNALDYFKDENKIDDGMIMADMNLAANTNTEVILFNIDSKSEADSKSNKDAIVEVFMKVFNEKQGFIGSMPFLAELERKLFVEGKFEAFRSKFNEINGSVWEDVRDDFYFIQDEIVDSLVSIGFMSEEAARNWCENAPETYTLSIEKFANMVREYLEKKGNNHHLIFLVDEIGQYIGDDSRLMLNLQTVAEDLGTMCGGKAWIVVTSQQDIDSITRVKGNDFSKIQGRFDTRLSLSSANVDEVIRKRILDKNDTAKQTLRTYYDQKESIIKNLITFDGTTNHKKYSDRDNYAEVYPFIPYQFNLLAYVLTSIREKGASGKHLSEGERSMIALFQESAITLKDREVGAIAPFNIFYNALHKFIDHTHSAVISRAEQNEDLNSFDVEVLKVLFMIKYVKEINATVGNLTTLMVSHIDDDRIALTKKIQDSLKALIDQTLVQKNGDIFIFLTNEEQDINKEIKNIPVETSEIINYASQVIFEEIYTDKKYRYNARYNFAFNQLVDERFYKNNQSNDIGLELLTPFNDNPASASTLRMISSQKNNVILQMPNDTTFLDEINEALKIDKFVRKQGSSMSGRYEEIKAVKQRELIDKKFRIKILIEEALKHSEIYVNGDNPQINAKDPVNRINDAMGKLVATRYHKLNYMETAPSISDINALFEKSNQISLSTGATKLVNKLALDDVLQFIELNTSRHIKTSMKSVMERFTTAPYGFVEDDIEWLIAMLFKQGSVKLTVNSKVVSLIDTETPDIIRYVTKREYVEKLLIEKQERPDDKWVKSVKEVMKALFGKSATSDEYDQIMSTFIKAADTLNRDLETLTLKYYDREHRFPGKSLVTDGKKLLKDIHKHTDVTDFFKHVFTEQDALLDLAEDLEPILQFFAGEQKDIFADACKKLDIFDNSKTFVVDNAIIETVENMRGIVKNRSPYHEIHKLPALTKTFIDKHTELLEKEAEPIKDDLKIDREKVFEVLGEKDYKDKFNEKFVKLFDELLNKLDTSNEVATVKNIRLESDALRTRCLNEIAEYDAILAREATEKYGKTNGGNDTGNDGNQPVAPPKPQPKQKKYKNLSLRTMTRGKTVAIEKAEDIDHFLATLKLQIMKELEEDTIISLSL